MRLYELVLVLKTSLSDVQRKKIFETIKGWLKEPKVKKEDQWGQKTLSYSLKKENTGFYVDLVFETDVIPADFEKKLLRTDEVLRHLLIRRK
jgi:ribosomal protein S6